MAPGSSQRRGQVVIKLVRSTSGPARTHYHPAQCELTTRQARDSWPTSAAALPPHPPPPQQYLTYGGWIAYPACSRVITVSAAFSGRYSRNRPDAAAAGIWNSMRPLRDPPVPMVP